MAERRELPDLRAGVYRHYKGHLYLVLGYGRDANDDDRDVVVYIGLELHGSKPGARIMVRTVDDFYAIVNPVTGESVADNWNGSEPYPVARFTYLGPDLRPGLLPSPNAADPRCVWPNGVCTCGEPEGHRVFANRPVS